MPAEVAAIDLQDPALYVNRDVSLLAFQERVLEEALDRANPLLERVKFLSIVGSNLDEFFMVRVSGRRAQLAVGAEVADPDGLSPAAQYCQRVEVLCPIDDSRLVRRLRDDILAAYLDDTVKTRRMRPDGSYERRVPPGGDARFNAQEWFLTHPGGGELRGDRA